LIVITLFKKEKKSSKMISIEKKNTVEPETTKTSENLDNRLKKIEVALDSLSKKPIVYNFNIDKLDIHNPILKELSFREDSVD